ncbi:MAG: septum formation initiator family protein [Bacteroidia bacterium]|nr:septum formation initiator family protein [Bacteroidia bacterium]MDW8348509.1 septum formation initiator family protein [Bacteroidia bacterium]
MNKLRENVLSYLTNKYVLVLLFLSVWMLFFDRNNIFTLFALRKKLHETYNDKKFYQKKIREFDSLLKYINEDKVFLENYAREKYFMKKDNEDIFIIVTPDEKENNEELN